MTGKSVINSVYDLSQDASLDLGLCERVLKFFVNKWSVRLHSVRFSSAVLQELPQENRKIGMMVFNQFRWSVSTRTRCNVTQRITVCGILLGLMASGSGLNAKEAVDFDLEVRLSLIHI